MRLDSLLSESDLAGSGLDVQLIGRRDTDVSSVSIDSRTVTPGCLFACVPGGVTDGHAYARSALERGAAALICERLLELDAPQVIVSSVRRSLGPVCDAMFGHPSRNLTVVGVTGTNGKTTTCAFLQEIFEANGWASTTIGTLTQSRTTPEAPDLHARLAAWRARGGRAVAMEVSSHTLVQHRTDAVRFAAGAFTNLSPEHLDYHGNLENYFEAKALLFQPGRVGFAAVNADDAWGRRLMDRLTRQGTPVQVFRSADASRLELSPFGSSFELSGHHVSLRLGGRFNVLNALAAATVARGVGVPPDVVATGLSRLESVAGRFELVSAGQPFTVIVDYAHTPDGLDKVLAAAREITTGRLIVVFGAGGDRDREKRPLMGEVASRSADLAVVTSDNPRSEDPSAIIAAVLEGAAGRANVVVEADRAAAITVALADARPGDTVVLAGKGHERTQEIAGRILPFDDEAVARRALEQILASRGDDR